VKILSVNYQLLLQKIKMSFIPNTKHMPARRYDLDWLRVLAFALLILFHIGMFYVENWGWHVKSSYKSQFLENIMLLIEPWRMAVLWVISGISIRFILAKVAIGDFILMRSYRLLLPLLFGILFVVPPQLYIEMTYNGDLNMSYLQFLGAFFADNNDVFAKYQAGIWPHIDVNHLWFIRSLWQFSLMLLILLPLLNAQWLNRAVQLLFKQHAIVAIGLPILPIFAIQVFWDSDTTRYPLGFAFMIYGYLIGWQPIFWQRLEKALPPLFIALIIGYCSFICIYNFVWVDEMHNEFTELLKTIGRFNYSALRIIGVLVALSLTNKFFNKKSAKLNYLNEAVYPFYILHQTIIVVVGYNLSLLKIGALLEATLLLIFTVAGCFIGFEIIRRTTLLRPCFGLKSTKNHHPTVQKLGYIAAILLVLPIAWKVMQWSVYLLSTLI